MGCTNHKRRRSRRAKQIEKILADCVILENWQSNGDPYSGKSYNIYNSALKRWEQFWVDNVGGNIFFYGGLKDGVMDYSTDELPQPDGTKLKRHLQFFPLARRKFASSARAPPTAEKTGRSNTTSPTSARNKGQSCRFWFYGSTSTATLDGYFADR